MLTALTLEKINPRIYTVAELLSRESVNHLRLAGVEAVIVGDELSSNLIATMILNRGTSPLVEGLFGTQDGCHLHRVDLPRHFIGKSFGSLFEAMKRGHDAMPISVERRSGGSVQMLTNPSLDLPLLEGDRVVVIARGAPKIPADS